MPTPAARATASRLASEPPAVNTAFAASRTRSRLRMASARGFRVLFSDSLMLIVRSSPLAKRRHPPYMASHADTYHSRQIMLTIRTLACRGTAKPCLRRNPERSDRFCVVAESTDSLPPADLPHHPSRETTWASQPLSP